MKKSPYDIVKQLHVTEKAAVLQGLKNSQSNRSVAACTTPKYVFLVDQEATKPEIAHAVEEIYKDKNIKVQKVNTINVKGKTRRLRGKSGMTAAFKKAVVTLKSGDHLEDL